MEAEQVSARTSIGRVLPLPALAVTILLCCFSIRVSYAADTARFDSARLEPASWPAVGWQSVADTDAIRLSRLWFSAQAAFRVHLQEYSFGWLETERPALRLRDYSLGWRETGHPLLAALLPEARFFLLMVLRRGSIGTPPYEALVFLGDSPYDVHELNSLLHAAGWAFDTSRSRDIARVAVLFMFLKQDALLYARQPSLPVYEGPRVRPPAAEEFDGATVRAVLDTQADSARLAVPSANPDSAALATAFPAIEFRFVAHDTASPSGCPGFCIHLDCMVNGESRTYHLGLVDGRPTVLLEDGKLVLRFDDLPVGNQDDTD